MPIVVDLSPVILLSRALRISRFFAALALCGCLIGVALSPASTWWFAIAGAAAIWCINRTPYRLPIFLWISLLCAAELFAAAWCLWQFAVVLRTAFSPRALGPFAAVLLVAYWLWKALYRITSDQPTEASPALFGVEQTLIERWFSSKWGAVFIGGVLIIVSLMVFVPTGDQIWACELLGVGILLVESAVLFLFQRSEQPANVLELNSCVRSRKAGTWASRILTFGLSLAG